MGEMAGLAGNSAESANYTVRAWPAGSTWWAQAVLTGGGRVVDRGGLCGTVAGLCDVLGWDALDARCEFVGLFPFID